jgi:hypothetical protein
MVPLKISAKAGMTRKGPAPKGHLFRASKINSVFINNCPPKFFGKDVFLCQIDELLNFCYTEFVDIHLGGKHAPESDGIQPRANHPAG